MNAVRAGLICLMALAGPVAAAPVQLMDGDAFAARVTGRTLHWSAGAAPAGAETYLPDQRVIWRAPDGPCKLGRWTADGPRICFVYEDSGQPICWLFAPEGDGLVARSMDSGGVLRTSAETTVPLACGPAFGV